MRRSMKKGFTLIELLIVVVIIGILAAVAIPKFSNTKQRASRSAGVADLRNLATAQEGFFADSAKYAALTNIGILPGMMNFAASQGNTLTIPINTTTGWNARLAIPGNQTCGIFSGNAPRPGTMPASIVEGVPACW